MALHRRAGKEDLSVVSIEERIRTSIEPGLRDEEAVFEEEWAGRQPTQSTCAVRVISPIRPLW